MKTKQVNTLAAALFAALLAGNVSAKENVSESNKGANPIKPLATACNRGSAQTDLAVNNVRTTILTSGDMWWDLGNARYEIPKGGGAHSIFAGSLWIGGYDAPVGGNLRVAAMTYRQKGVDFWPGPMDTANYSVDINTCAQYDKHFRINRKDVEDFYAAYLNGFSGYSIPSSILNWPGNGDASLNQGNYLAPFYDANGNGVYEPLQGEYPDYDITGDRGCSAKLFGDETLWWVFNDVGNIHTESSAPSIGLEIRAQAFGFNTNDEVSDMTFYNYQIINRSTYTIDSCFFGQWVDPDLGEYQDDFVGCDVGKGLGMCYNGDNQDGTGPAPGVYSGVPPAVGVDFFQGPIADANDGVDNDRDCIVDEVGEQVIMSKFVYYNNDASMQGNPGPATDFYNYLIGKWRDGKQITYGGNGYTGTVPANFMFPGTSDLGTGWGLGGTCTSPVTGGANVAWDEVTAGNTPADRRFLQSCGPFTLKPGAVNYITVGVVWAKATQGNNLSSVVALTVADDKAQKLFDNCFQVLNGPDAPDMTIQELRNELVFYLTNKTTSNNYNETYVEYDPAIVDPGGIAPNRYDTTYDFEGYQVFQVKDATVSVTDLHDASKARLAFQCDRMNGAVQLVNYYYDKNISASVPIEEVNGENKGISHSFSLKNDLFATGTPTLVNHKTYYYMVIAYGYNEYAKYDAGVNFDPTNIFGSSNKGQKQPYKAGRRNIRVYSAIPHDPSPELGGTHQHSSYGSGPKITRIEGRGNGGNTLELTQSSIDAIMSSTTWSLTNPTYENGMGPIRVKVIDPLNVKDGDFTVKLDGILPTSNWTLTDNGNGKVYSSDKQISLESVDEKIIVDLGLSVSITQVNDAGNTADEKLGFLSGTMTFSNPDRQWLSGLADAEGYTNRNWIRCGQQAGTGAPSCAPSYNDIQGLDDGQVFENVIGGTWAPYRLVACNDKPYHPDDTSASCPGQSFLGSPGWKSQWMAQVQLKDLSSVNVVITADKSKWTRCVVLDMCEWDSLSTKDASVSMPSGYMQKRMDMRVAPSVDKNGNKANPSSGPSTNPDDPNYISATGMGWFPGYAINLETGERLNMAFGENSMFTSENGADMIWNPTKNVTSSNYPGHAVNGGGHYIYVFGHVADGANDCPRYDAGQFMRNKLNVASSGDPNDVNKRAVFKTAMWVNIPLLKDGATLLDNDVTVRLRVRKPYQKYYYTNTAADSANPAQNANKPMYHFSTSDIVQHLNDNETAKNALDMINIVPNPYYAYSEYEKNKLDYRVKITNLPDKCTIKVYTLSGTLIRTFKKDDTKTSLDWDLKNQKGIPIASGMYIFHVDADGVGEKILKWFGVMRPLDLDQF